MISKLSTSRRISNWFCTFFLITSVRYVAAFTNSKHHRQQSTLHPSVNNDISTTQSQHHRQKLQLNEKRRNVATIYDEEEDCNKFDPCARIIKSEEDDYDLDRREATFAMIGTLWAITGAVIPTSLLFPTQPAYAEYGDEPKMVLPNPYQDLSDRSNKQCLVESLGNRQCLVYADEANFLYKGGDTKALLDRIEKASTALGTIPDLVQSKKWIGITGVLTGPMGELIRNMGQLADLSDNKDKAKDMIKIVKTDLYVMSDGVNRKDQDLVLRGHDKVTNDLVAFIKTL